MYLLPHSRGIYVCLCFTSLVSSQIAKVRDVSKDMEFVCKSERELSLVYCRFYVMFLCDTLIASSFCRELLRLRERFGHNHCVYFSYHVYQLYPQTLTSERTFVSHERNTFFTFLNTIQVCSVILMCCTHGSSSWLTIVALSADAQLGHAEVSTLGNGAWFSVGMCLI